MVGYNRRIHEGIDNIIKYGKPEMLKQTVSATSGTPEEIAAGIVPNYDRYVTHYKSKSKPFNPVEGMGVFVDVEPELDETGNLVMEEMDIRQLRRQIIGWLRFWTRKREAWQSTG